MAESDDKTEEATPQKLSKAREKGDVPKSQDVSQLATLLGGVSVLLIAGGFFSQRLMNDLLPFVAHPDEFSMDGVGARQVGIQAIQAALPMIAAVTLTAAIAGACSHLFQGGFMFTPEKLKPDLKKLNPLSALKRIYGPDGFVQFLKTLVKLVVTGIVAWLVIEPHVPELQNLAWLSPSAMMPLAVRLLRSLIMAVLILLIATAAFDWFFQRIRFAKRMRMSKEEVKEEHKQSDGDPHVKARQRQIRMQQSRRRMMQNVPKATVVVMNPTHYAVALRYEPGETAAPICVAKGVDELALKIRAVAEEHGVSVIEDPPLARSLYASVEIDDEIPQQHFEAVAKIISFILGNKDKSRQRARPL
ncbi:flagellar biosynthesis protein FlhB [Caulobacter sp. NIBR2454]|uniref:flagellar biosynthesis protein FlhB n=1 Tax=Caulobacter sp. NIBR2454 TaxID=3015996 RepID=UPI0022B6EED0|nr:flagellar biosynthesis protein FlhB [Caulobacter sp. NIBR2454]